MRPVLCGFAASNYYNKAKLALLEKGIGFDEEFLFPSDDDAFRAVSPRGKIPLLRVGDRTLCESQAIVEYLEDAYREVPLYPADPLGRARSRAVLQVMEVYVELVARRLYPAAYFGAPLAEALKDQVAGELRAGIAALGRCLEFGPFIGGERLGLPDVAAICHLPLASATTKKIYGEDWLAGIAGLDGYLAMMAQRPHVVAVEQGRQAGLAPFIAAVKKKYGLP
jgi:glutathione S-transferase